MEKIYLKMNLIGLYSNTPNPIVLQRFNTFKKNDIDFKILYGLRHLSKIKLDVDKKYINSGLEPIEIDDVRGLAFKRLYILYLFYNAAVSRRGHLYAFYPDMLFVAILIRIRSGFKKKIFYEIQDLHYKNIFLRLAHNIFMLFANKIFLTSKFFTVDYLYLFKKTLMKKSLYVSNAPNLSDFKFVQHSLEKRSNPTIGFIGNLRDIYQLEVIEFLLEKTSLNVLQAGASDYKGRLKKLELKYESRFTSMGKFNFDDLSNIWKKVDFAWCVYPETYNYKYHTARRLHEAAHIGIPVILSEHALGNIQYAKEYNLKYIKFKKDDLNYFLKKIYEYFEISNHDKACSKKNYETYELFNKRHIRAILGD